MILGKTTLKATEMGFQAKVYIEHKRSVYSNNNSNTKLRCELVASSKNTNVIIQNPSLPDPSNQSPPLPPPLIPTTSLSPKDPTATSNPPYTHLPTTATTPDWNTASCELRSRADFRAYLRRVTRACVHRYKLYLHCRSGRVARAPKLCLLATDFYPRYGVMRSFTPCDAERYSAGALMMMVGGFDLGEGYRTFTMRGVSI